MGCSFHVGGTYLVQGAFSVMYGVLNIFLSENLSVAPPMTFPIYT